MSILGLDKIQELIKTHDLITGLAGRDAENPEGCGIDLRIGSAHRITEGGAFIEADGQAEWGKRKGVKTEEVYRFDPAKPAQENLIVKPSEYYLVQTVETIHTPDNLMTMVYPRGSLFRSGLLLLTSKGDPGYTGVITMALTNLSPFPVTLQMGARICNIVFHEIEGKTVSYRGQHQHGRLTPENEERQV